MNDGDMDLVEAEPEIVGVPAEPEYESYLAHVEMAAKYRDRVLQVVAALTLPSDWLDQDGKPYLQACGAERLRQRFGIAISRPTVTREIREDSHGPYYRYRYECEVRGPHCPPMPAIGIASARDKFFALRDGKLIPAEDVDEGLIEKKAYTNMLVNAVTRALGLRGLTWEILQRAGIRKEVVPSVPYKSKRKQQEPQPTAITEDIRQMITDIILAETPTLDPGSEEFARRFADAMRRYSSFKITDKQGERLIQGKPKPEELSPAWARKTYERIKKDWELMQPPESAEEADEPDTEPRS